MGYRPRNNPIIKLRDFYLTRVKWRKHSFGAHFHAGKNVRLWAKNKIAIGKFCYLGAGTVIQCDAVLGDYVFTANNVAFVGRYDHCYQELGKPMLFCARIKDHDYNWKGLNSTVVIEDDVWIGYGATIMSGVKIGIGSIIAAGSIVTKNVEPYSIYGGVPAVKLTNRFETETDLKNHIRLYKENFQ